MSQFGSSVVQQATANHTATLIFLHGLGDSGAGLASIGPALRLPYVKVRDVRVCEVWQDCRIPPFWYRLTLDSICFDV